MTLTDELRRWLKGADKLVIMGIGNPMRGDDAVGLEVVERLKRWAPGWVTPIKCETTPENFLGVVEEQTPTHVLMVDAAHLNAEPGACRLVPPEWVVGSAISTHKLPLYIAAEYIKRTTGARVAILAVQPACTQFNTELTKELKEAVERITKGLKEAIEEVNEARRTG